MFTFLAGIRTAKKCICIFLIVLALSVTLSQAVNAKSPPALDVSGSATYVVAGGPVLVAPGMTLTGGDINQVLVSITDNFTSSDSLGIQGMTGTTGSLSGIDWSYDELTGVMDLHNTAAASVYQSVLRQVNFYSTSDALASRTIVFSVVNDSYFASTGHFYRYIASPLISWDNASTAAAGLNYYGKLGYLATVTSQAENDFILSKLGEELGGLAGLAWMGASDNDNESFWRWVTGPEGAADDGKGTYFFHQTKCFGDSPNLSIVYPTVGSGGEAIDGQYKNWDPNQPDDAYPGEDYAHFYYNYYSNSHPNGSWNDYPGNNGVSSFITGYVVEYGGLPGDTDYVTVNFELSADLSITKSGTPNPVFSGGQLLYTLSVTNQGPGEAAGVVVTDTYPEGFVFKSSVPPPDPGTNNIWTFNSIDNDTTRTISIRGTVNGASASLNNVAGVTSSTTDLDEADNTVSNDVGVVYQGVGGEVVQVNKPALLVPGLFILGILMFGWIFLVLNRRKRS